MENEAIGKFIKKILGLQFGSLILVFELDYREEFYEQKVHEIPIKVTTADHDVKTEYYENLFTNSNYIRYVSVDDRVSVQQIKRQKNDELSFNF